MFSGIGSSGASIQPMHRTMDGPRWITLAVGLVIAVPVAAAGMMFDPAAARVACVFGGLVVLWALEPLVLRPK